MLRRRTATAALDGREFHFEKARPGNTFDARRGAGAATGDPRGAVLRARHTHAISGAPSSEMMLAALTTAWAAQAGAAEVVEGSACGPDGCG